MPNFAYVRDGIVKHVQTATGSNPVEEKWIALFRSGVLLKDSGGHDVMPGDLFIDDKFYKKDIETGETTLLEDGLWSHPKAVRFAGIMDGEIVGQWGIGKELFADQSEIDEFTDNILNSQIVEIEQDSSYLVEKNWIYDGTIFSAPDNA